MYYYYTRAQHIAENECQQSYEHAAGQNICVSRTPWEVTICTRNPNSFVQSSTWNYHRKPSWWLKPEPHCNTW